MSRCVWMLRYEVRCLALKCGGLARKEISVGDRPCAR